MGNYYFIVENVPLGGGLFTGPVSIEPEFYESGVMKSALVSFGYNGSLGKVEYNESGYWKLVASILY